jgi:hypothetical protein
MYVLLYWCFRGKKSSTHPVQSEAMEGKRIATCIKLRHEWSDRQLSGVKPKNSVMLAHERAKKKKKRKNLLCNEKGRYVKSKKSSKRALEYSLDVGRQTV